MAQNWHDAPEVATQNSYPEVYYPKPAPVAPYRPENYPAIPLKSFNPYDDRSPTVDTPQSSFPGAIKSVQNYDSQSTQNVLPPGERSKGLPRRFRGCSVVVLALSVIIALLSIVVIGLAAGTGIQTNKARDAESKLAAYLSNSTSNLGCSAKSDTGTGTRYTSSFFGRQSFGIYCNSDAPNPPLQSIFVGTFGDCLDACASYSTYTPGNFPNVTTSKNFTCSAVSFIPDWTNRTEALMVNAPGNCYLKPGPQNPAAFTHPSANGTPVHAAILLS